jgi:hypothetical protein
MKLNSLNQWLALLASSPLSATQCPSHTQTPCFIPGTYLKQRQLRVDDQGKPMLKKRLSRNKGFSVLCESAEPGGEIGMEACGGAHHWARQLQARGYVVKVIAPQFVTP